MGRDAEAVGQGEAPLSKTSKRLLALLTVFVGVVDVREGGPNANKLSVSSDGPGSDNPDVGGDLALGGQDRETGSGLDEVPVDPELPLPPPPPGSGRLYSSRFLLGLSAIDALSWTVGKAMQFESLQIAQKIGLSYVTIALLLTTIEVVVEFVASSCAPMIYRCVQRSSTFTSRNLAEATFKAYGASCVMACVVYPILGILMWFVFEPSMAFLVATIVLQSIQYAFLNQVGDALREMAQPHWLHTLQGFDLVFPGRSWGLRRRVTAESLAIYLQLSFMFVGFIFGAIYTLLKDIDAARWGLALGASVFNATVFLLLLPQLKTLSGEIVESVADREASRSLVLWPWRMKPFEVKLVILLITVLAVPEQAYNSILAVLVLELEGFLGTAVVGIAGLVVFLFLMQQIWRLHPVPQSHITDEAVVLEGKYDYWYWMLAVFGILLTLGGGAAGLYAVAGTGGVLLSMISFVGVRPFIVKFTALVDAFLFIYNSQRGSNIRLWVNVCTVLVNGPILAMNWWAVNGGLEALGIVVTEEGAEGEDADEQRQAAVVLFLSILIVGVVFVYFSFIDPYCCRGSLHAAVTSSVRKHAT